MKMPNMGNSFAYFPHSSVPGVKWRALNPGQNPTGQNPTLTKPHRQNPTLTKPHQLFSVKDKTPDSSIFPEMIILMINIILYIIKYPLYT